jgi:outer membrane protein assembly factor BamB
MIDSPHRPNWTLPIAMIVLLAVTGAAAFFGWTAVGDPTADFLAVVAVAVAGSLGWTYFDRGLTRRQRLGFVALLIAAPVIGLSFTDFGPMAALRDMFRRQSEPSPIAGPPPKEFIHEYPKSEIVPDLTKTSEHDWPAYLHDGTGRAATPIRFAGDWKKNPPKLLWQHPLGGGAASPVVVGDFLVDFEQRGKDEVVACYELRTGKQCWEHREEQYSYGPYTGPGPKATPVIANGAVVTLGGHALLLCLEGSTGQLRWKQELFARHKADAPGYGITASPTVVGDLVVVGIGGKDGSLVAYDLNSGELRWTSGTAPASYSSPMVATVAGMKQIVWFHQPGVVGFDVNDGRVLWSAPWNNGVGNNVCQPLCFSTKGTPDLDAVLISAGDDAGCAAFAVERISDGFTAKELWKNKNLKLKYSTAIHVRDMAVGFDERLLAAIDLKTGERRWKHSGRFGYGQIVANGDQLLIQAEDGRIVLGVATDKGFIKKGEIQSVLKQTWNAPALSGDLLVLRNHETLAVYKLPTE